MNINNANSPDYNNPPVTEVVIGVQFGNIGKFEAPYPGLYWQTIRDRYPEVEVHPPIQPSQEIFPDQQQPRIEGDITPIPPLARCWFLDDSKNHLVQIQPNRFIHNWRKLTASEDYPRFETIIKEFKELWNGFKVFVQEENQLGEINPNHWEVTYVNHMYVGSGWDSMKDISNLFPCWAGNTSGSYLREPEKISFNVSYAFPEHLGRLHISLEPGIMRQKNEKLLRLTLTARGRLEANDTNVLLDCLEQGHQWIINGFTDFTSNEAHQIWKRKE